MTSFSSAPGSLVPGDGIVLEAADCFINEAVLTGESYPVEKIPDVVPAETPLARRRNCVFLGTNVRSGTARCLIVRTGRETQLGTSLIDWPCSRRKQNLIAASNASAIS